MRFHNLEQWTEGDVTRLAYVVQGMRLSSNNCESEAPRSIPDSLKRGFNKLSVVLSPPILVGNVFERHVFWRPEKT